MQELPDEDHARPVATNQRNSDMDSREQFDGTVQSTPDASYGFRDWFDQYWAGITDQDGEYQTRSSEPGKASPNLQKAQVKVLIYPAWLAGTISGMVVNLGPITNNYNMTQEHEDDIPPELQGMFLGE